MTARTLEPDFRLPIKLKDLVTNYAIEVIGPSPHQPREKVFRERTWLCEKLIGVRYNSGAVFSAPTMFGAAVEREYRIRLSKP